RVRLGDELVPAVDRRALDELIEAFGPAGVESEVVQAGAGALVLTGGQVRGLFDDEVRHAQPPAAPTRPFLELLITKLAQQPAPLNGGAVNVGNPQLDVRSEDRRVGKEGGSVGDTYAIAERKR